MGKSAYVNKSVYYFHPLSLSISVHLSLFLLLRSFSLSSCVTIYFFRSLQHYFVVYNCTISVRHLHCMHMDLVNVHLFAIKRMGTIKKDNKNIVYLYKRHFCDGCFGLCYFLVLGLVGDDVVRDFFRTFVRIPICFQEKSFLRETFFGKLSLHIVIWTCNGFVNSNQTNSKKLMFVKLKLPHSVYVYIVQITGSEKVI